MALFVLIGRDGARGPELRAYHREAHLRNLEPLARAGRVVYAGPLLDDAGAPCGSVVVFDAADLDAARRFAAGDPYVVEGIFERWEVLGTRQVFPGAGSC
ncbi:MAG TPA: YciI family protein [Myxococcota bacterium]|nr:YciI family protein [Myxococcota bacterium]